jgi:thiazole synthase
MDTPLTIAGRTFGSRLLVGTGKYPDYPTMVKALEASGAEIVTVAVRRVNLDRSKESLLDHIDPKKYTLLPNTAACYTADDAVRTCLLAREAGMSNLVKLEVIGDEKTLFPDTEGLLAAARLLVKEGFVVLPYTNDDPIMAKKLEDAGCAAVMPLAAPIGSGLGIRNPYNIRRPDEHGDRGSEGPRGHGGSDAGGGLGGTQGLPGGADPEEALRHILLPDRRDVFLMRGSR